MPSDITQKSSHGTWLKRLPKCSLGQTYPEKSLCTFNDLTMQCAFVRPFPTWGGGGDQAYSWLSTTHGYIADCNWIRWRMQVYACELMWTCLVWAQRSTPNGFWVPSHRFNSATGEQKGITQTIYTDSKPPTQLPNSLMPSAKLRSANLPVFTSLVWRGQGSNPGLPHPEQTL